MKILLATVALLIGLSACTGSSKKTILILKDDYVSLKVCVNTSKQELTDIAAQLKQAKDIDLNFSQTTFNSDGTIDQLDLKINCQGMAQATVQADLYMSDDYYGFFRDYRPNANPPFRCGAI